MHALLNNNLISGNRGAGRTPLDWVTRIKIALGAARGIAHIHSAGGGKFTHGNIKSSNVLLNQDRSTNLILYFLILLNYMRLNVFICLIAPPS